MAAFMNHLQDLDVTIRAFINTTKQTIYQHSTTNLEEREDATSIRQRQQIVSSKTDGN